MKNSKIERLEVEGAIKAGDVRVQFDNPLKPKLAILNYTEQATFNHSWNEITRRCRGLVVEWKTKGKYLPIIIESPQKFFNNVEPEAPDLTKWKFSQIFVSEKLDGYYISIRNDSKHGLIVTSRGSFDNKYVDAAKKLLPSKIPKDTDFFCELCQDFEGDESVIVMKHHEPKLVCWGVNKNVPTPQDKLGWDGEIAWEVTEQQLKQYMMQEVEGVVAFNKLTGERVKIKTQWYLDMHRIISDCSFKKTLDIVCGGGQIRGETTTLYKDASGEKHELNLTTIPEEHYIKMCEWEKDILEQRTKILLKAQSDYEQYKTATPKEYALNCKTDKDIKGVVFDMFRKKDITEKVWKIVKKRLLRNTAD